MNKLGRHTLKTSLNRLGKKIPWTVVYLLIFGYSSIICAAPSGGHITGGSGVIQQSNLTTTIQQNTSSLVINWNSFNVNQNETVNFLQPNSSSIALNRILSTILGTHNSTILGTHDLINRALFAH